MASGNMKDIKRRIKSVQSTMQITKAMELVASSKLRRAKERVEKARPYFNALYTAMKRIATDSKGSNSIFIKQREIHNSTYIVIAGDRGLAGGYNSNIFKMAMADMEGKSANVITVGRKSMEFFDKKSYKVLSNHPGIAETLSISDTYPIITEIMDTFKRGETDAVYLCYTEFVSAMTQEPKMIRLLPVEFESGEPSEKRELTEYDPSPEAVFNEIIPKYLAGVLYGAIVESFASEQSARRMAMESASDNAGEMIDTLNLSYNRARQSAITQEITEIVAGSGAIN